MPRRYRKKHPWQKRRERGTLLDFPRIAPPEPCDLDAMRAAVAELDANRIRWPGTYSILRSMGFGHLPSLAFAWWREGPPQ
jgi:hypothetical protein